MKEKAIIIILIISTILLVSLAGCNSKGVEGGKESSVKPADINSDKVVEYSKEDIMKDFRNIVKSNNEPFVLVKFIDENIGKIETEDAVEMIKELEKIQLQYVEKYTDEMFIEDYQRELWHLSETEENVDLFFNMNEIDKIENAGLKELMEKLLDGKYKLIGMEGAFYPIIDYEALKTYNKYLSNEIKSYLDIKSMDSNMPAVIDAGITVSFDELANRLLKIEEHIKKFPECTDCDEVLRLYGAYLKLYLEGADNTPIYDYESKEIKDEVLASYENMAKLEDSISGNAIKKYLDIIKINDNVIDDNVLSKITEVYNGAIAQLEEVRENN